MYQMLVLLIGVMLSIMISINGNLTAAYGLFPAAAIIHIVGSLVAALLCCFQKDKKPLLGHRPVWIYLGGVIGVFTTVFNNLAYGHISMTSIVALGLLGQTITALIFDTFGLLGMKKQPFQKSSLLGLIFSLIGIILMMDNTVTQALIAVIVSLISGATVVLSRTVNFRLAEAIGALRGSLVNHLAGLPITLVLAIGSIFFAKGITVPENAAQPWIYVGGAFGVVVVVLFNLTVPRIASFQLTLLSFVGQIFTGVLIDVITGCGYSDASFLGGIVIAAGVAIGIMVERVTSIRKLRGQNSKIEG